MRVWTRPSCPAAPQAPPPAPAARLLIKSGLLHVVQACRRCKGLMRPVGKEEGGFGRGGGIRHLVVCSVIEWLDAVNYMLFLPVH